MAGKLQNEDFKTEAELTGAGGAKSQLLNDTKIYITADSINKTLDDAITDGDIGGGGTPTLTGITAVLRDIKADATSGGTFTSGAWQTRTLNTEDDPGGIVTLSANQFTLQAGTYRIRAEAPVNRVDQHQAKIINITDLTTVNVSPRMGAPSGGGEGNNVAIVITDEFTIASAKVFELQHRCGTTRATDGFGQASVAMSESSSFAQVQITKLD